MENKRKYKVEFNFKDGSKDIYVGTGTPRMSLTEYFVLSPDGQEIVILKENVRSFVITPYEEICYKTDEVCKHDCSGLCKESY